MRQQLTENQRKVFHFLVAFHQEEDRLPSTREMQHRFGWQSQTAAINYLKTLACKGWLEHRHSIGRGELGWWRFSRL